MTTAAIALLVALAALMAAAALLLVVLRSRRAADAVLAAGLLEVSARMDGLAHELAGAVERIREDALRTRIAESIGQAADRDEVLARCVEAAAALPGVAAAVASVDVDGERLHAAVGLASSESTAVGGPPDGAAVRAVGISYHYPASADPGALRSAIAVPLEADDGTRLGFLTVLGRSEEPPVAGADFATLEAIARQAGSALSAARRSDNAPSGRERDPLTGLGNRQALHRALALEAAESLRHGRKLALCAIDLDGFRHANELLGHLGGDAVLVEVANLLRATIRPDDRVFRSGGDEFTVILPGAGRIEGEELATRLQAALSRLTDAPASAVSLSAGVAELKPEDDGVSLYERTERALQREKERKRSDWPQRSS